MRHLIFVSIFLATIFVAYQFITPPEEDEMGYTTSDDYYVTALADGPYITSFDPTPTVQGQETLLPTQTDLPTVQVEIIEEITASLPTPTTKVQIVSDVPSPPLVVEPVIVANIVVETPLVVIEPTATLEPPIGSEVTVALAADAPPAVVEPLVAADAPPPPEILVLAEAPEGYDEMFKGVFYKDLGGIVIIRARLNDPDVKFFVGHPDKTTTVCRQLDLFDMQIAVNGSGFYMDTGVVEAFGMVDGDIYSESNRPDITIIITDENEVIFSQGESLPDNAKYAVTGFNRVVLNGKVQDRFYQGHEDYKAGYGTVRPRTTISTDGTYLTIVLFESPSTVTAAGEYVLENFPGTSDVFNMDGGGSTNACAQGIGPLVPETGRPVANTFGIFAPNK